MRREREWRAGRLEVNKVEVSSPTDEGALSESLDAELLYRLDSPGQVLASSKVRGPVTCSRNKVDDTESAPYPG